MSIICGRDVANALNYVCLVVVSGVYTYIMYIHVCGMIWCLWYMMYVCGLCVCGVLYAWCTV